MFQNNSLLKMHHSSIYDPYRDNKRARKCLGQFLLMLWVFAMKQILNFSFLLIWYIYYIVLGFYLDMEISINLSNKLVYVRENTWWPIRFNLFFETLHDRYHVLFYIP